MSWQGFDNDREETRESGGGLAVSSARAGRKLPSSSSSRQKKLLQTAVAKDVVSSLPPEARLVPPQELPPKPQPSDSGTNGSSTVSAKDTSSKTAAENGGKSASENDGKIAPDSGGKSASPPDNFETPPPENRQKNRLEDFQTKQKIIEEQNRLRKQLLTEAIKSKRRQTNEEAKKLESIQQELVKIDASLNTDVRFLRDSIEEASLTFLEAQKRYNKAETEFISAKLHLFETLERKEMLTDHLCAIIEQNEMRKAKKLEELMTELSLVQDTSETVQVSVANVSLAELRSTPEEVTTIRRPQPPSGPSPPAAATSPPPPPAAQSVGSTDGGSVGNPQTTTIPPVKQPTSPPVQQATQPSTPSKS